MVSSRHSNELDQPWVWPSHCAALGKPSWLSTSSVLSPRSWNSTVTNVSTPAISPSCQHQVKTSRSGGVTSR